MRARIAAFHLAVAACLLVASPAAGAPRCPSGFTCSEVAVPLDRADPQSPALNLRVARHRASARAGKPALIAFAGGPGQAAVPFARQYASALKPGLRRYQLVLFDQRGTGASALDCPAVQAAGEFPALEEAQRAIAACGASQGRRAGDYSTAATVEDIEAVRQSVGAEKVALVGVSYGTHVIQRYLLAHPDRVDRIVLDSTVAPGGVDQFQLDSYSAVQRVLRRLGGARAVADTAQLVGQLAQGTYGGTAYGPDGRPRDVTVHGSGQLFTLLVAGDLDPVLRSQYAPAVRSALRGDRLPLMRLIALAGSAPDPPVALLSAGLYAATTCTDVRMPWAASSPVDMRAPLFDAAVAALDPAALAPFDASAARATSVSGACLGWPAVSVTPDDVPAAYPAVPALILAGTADVRTPVESARKVAALMPGARLITVPGVGHDTMDGDFTGCARAAIGRFLAGRDAGRPCKGSGGLELPVPTFPLRLADVRDHGARTRARQVLAAVMDTVVDAETMLSTGGLRTVRRGGLRGGFVRASGRPPRVELRRYTYLPGLHVTGSLRWGEGITGVLRVSGIADGRVSLRHARVIATIDGHRVTSRRSGVGL
jgi:pimeloyl-ACP methyl ester carboxylesterase